VLDFFLYVVLELLAVITAVFGGYLTSKKRRNRRVFVGCGVLSAVLIPIVGFRNHQAQEALSQAITGGDSYAYVAPQPGMIPIPLVIWNAGNYTLNGVTVTIHNGRDFTNASAFLTRPILNVGVLAPHGHQLLPVFITPDPEPDGMDTYDIVITAQNGEVNQLLQFRKAEPLKWERRYSITRYIPRKDNMQPIAERVKDEDWFVISQRQP
jgi:hypothetical protein